MIISLTNRKERKILAQEEVSWKDLTEMLSSFETKYKSKEEVPQFSACEFSDLSFKGKGNEQKMHFAVLDFDDITKEAFDSTLKKLKLYSYVAYTSWSHSKDKETNGLYRFRAVFPFAKPVSKALWPQVAKKLSTMFDGVDKQALGDMVRFYHIPAHLPGKESDHWVKTNVGLDFDVETFLKSSVTDLSDNKITAADLSKLADRLAKKKSPVANKVAESIRQAVLGQPIAPIGERDQMLYVLAQEIAEAFPEADPKQIAAVFDKSVSEMHKDSNGTNSPTWFLDKLVRAKEKVKAKKEETKAQESEELSFKIRQAFGEKSNRQHPYTEEELNSFAEQAGCSREAFMRRWIIQNETSYYIFFNGKYEGPIGERSIVSICDLYLSAAISAGVHTSKADSKGNVRQKTKEELVNQYGTPAINSRASLCLQHSIYDSETKTFIEATCPLRVKTAKYDPEIAEWLALLAGEDLDRLLGFMSVITDHKRPCSALYLHSQSGFGKNILVAGLARLWTTEAQTTLADALKTFNSSIAACPLIHADETMPENFRKNGNSGEWREFIQATQRWINRKFMKPLNLEGCIRLIMTANNKDMLGTREDLTPNDIEAIVDRVCFIDCNNVKAREFLEERSWEQVESFIKDDRIAMHALWLKENHVITNKSRFIISARNSPFHRSMASGQGLGSVVSHWLVSYLQDPARLDLGHTCAGMIRIHEGRLLVTTKAINDAWALYDTHTNPPTPSKISKALLRLCYNGEKKVLRHKGNPLKYWVVDPESLINWAEDNAYASREDILEALSKETKIRGNDMFAQVTKQEKI